MRFFILVSVLFFLNTSWASPTKVAGGGFVVKCKIEKGDTFDYEYTTYDIWEQSSLFKNVNYGLVGEDWKEKVEFAISRIEKFEPYLGGIIKKSFLTLIENFDELVVPRISIPDFKDYREVIGFNNCEKIPAAMQLKSPLYGQYRFYFSEEIWKNLDSFNRATLVLHEILYKSFIATKNEKFSDFVRYYNFIISSTLMNSITQREYFRYRFARQKSVIEKIKEALDSIKYLLMTEVHAGFHHRVLKTLNLIPIALATPEIDPYGPTMSRSPNGFKFDVLDEIIKLEHKNSHNIMLYLYGTEGLIKQVSEIKSIKRALKNQGMTLTMEEAGKIFYDLHKFVDGTWERFLKSLFGKVE
jgi:hypothetical protein